MFISDLLPEESKLKTFDQVSLFLLLRYVALQGFRHFFVTYLASCYIVLAVSVCLFVCHRTCEGLDQEVYVYREGTPTSQNSWVHISGHCVKVEVTQAENAFL